MEVLEPSLDPPRGAGRTGAAKPVSLACNREVFGPHVVLGQHLARVRHAPLLGRVLVWLKLKQRVRPAEHAELVLAGDVVQPRDVVRLDAVLAVTA